MKSNNTLVADRPSNASVSDHADTTAAEAAPALTVLSSEDAFGVCDLDGNCH
ncbi:MAG: hypothetical protein LKI58_10805 [Actinomyces sp.]|jgi:hypothetical protein|nr:hypothetical protein [Actinomyces sp.]MCI1788527.1 hypothetical protein [Actinomyces sp.]